MSKRIIVKKKEQNPIEIGLKLGLVCIGDSKNIVKETEKAILYKVGTTNLGLPIEVFFPKSRIYENSNMLFIPISLAKQKGIGWYLNINNDYEDYDYVHAFEDENDLVNKVKDYEHYYFG